MLGTTYRTLRPASILSIDTSFGSVHKAKPTGQATPALWFGNSRWG
jgi:hypothetical protein